VFVSFQLLLLLFASVVVFVVCLSSNRPATTHLPPTENSQLFFIRGFMSV